MTGEAPAASRRVGEVPPITQRERPRRAERLSGKPPAESPLREGEEPSAKPEPLPDRHYRRVERRGERDGRECRPLRRVKAPPAGGCAEIPAPPAAPSEPAGKGLEIQVSAFRDRKGADVLANRLNSKGYTAYVVPPGPGAPALFRVRVGKFKERREADAVAARLKKEESSTPGFCPLALFSGALLALSFPRYGHGAVAFIALVPWFVALTGWRGAPARCRARPSAADSCSGLLTGGVHFAGTVYWTGATVADLRRVARSGRGRRRLAAGVLHGAVHRAGLGNHRACSCAGSGGSGVPLALPRG